MPVLIYCTLKFFCYISDKQFKNNKYYMAEFEMKVYFFQLGMTFHGMGPLQYTHFIEKDI